MNALDDILLLETATDLLEEAEKDDFSFVDSMLLDVDNFDVEEEDNSYV